MNTMQSTATTQSSVQHEALDLTYLHTISGGDEAFEKEMMQSLLSEMSEKMTALSVAIQQADVKNVQMNAHSLKNLASIIGVASLAEGFKVIEHSCEEVPNAFILQQFVPCESQWMRSKEAIATWLSNTE